MSSLVTEFVDILKSMRDNHQNTFYAMKKGCRFVSPDLKKEGDPERCLYFGRPGNVCAMEACPLLMRKGE
jgi:hypothetical protein